jgi:hypothetical protein
MKVQRTFLAILSVLLLTSSCALFKPDVVNVPVYVESTIPIREYPKPLNLIAPKLEVVSRKNLDEFIEGNEKRNGSLVFIAMDVREYETSAYNFAEIDRYVKQLIGLVKYYEDQIASREDAQIPEAE